MLGQVGNAFQVEGGAEGDDQVIVFDSECVSLDLARNRVDAGDGGVYYFDAAPAQLLVASSDGFGAAFADDQPEQRGCEGELS